MVFPVEDGLIEMGHAPALGNVEVEPLGQRIGCGAGGGVAPGAERRQLVAVLVKGQVAVHHGRNAQGAHRGQRFAAGVPVVLGQVAVGILDARPRLPPAGRSSTRPQNGFPSRGRRWPAPNRRDLPEPP